MSTVTIILRGEPTPWARAGHKGRVSFTPKRQREAMQTLKYVAGIEMGERVPLEGPLSASFVFCYPWPASMSKKRRAAQGSHWKTSRPDASNLLKLIEDALTGVVWLDDAQIVQIGVQKYYDTIPRVELRVSACRVEHPIPMPKDHADEPPFDSNEPVESNKWRDKKPI